MVRHLIAMSWLVTSIVWAAPASVVASPQYYIIVRGVEGPQGMGAEDPAISMAREILGQELSKHPEVVQESGDLPAADSPDLGEALKRRHLKGYQVTVRFLEVRRALLPPPPGKPYRVLERGVKLTLVGTTLPGDQLALGGDGESTVQADVGQRISERQERDALGDALRDALSQAVSQALQKLKLGPMASPKDRPRKHH